MTKLDMLKSLVEKTTDKAELDKLNGEILAEVRAEEKAKLEKEFADKAADEARAKALADQPKPVKGSGIEVGVPDRYKGRRFKAEMDGVSKLSSAFKSDHNAEIVTKVWLDKLSDAKANIGKTTYQSETAGEGGYLVAPEYPSLYFEYAAEFSRALQICDSMRMTSNVMYVPTESAKVSVAQTAEGVDATVTSAVFAQSTLTAKRFDAYTNITNELLDDENYPILPILMRQFTEAIGQKVDSAVFNASGDPMSSVFSAAAGYSVVLGTGSSTFATVVFSSFLEVVGKLPSAYNRNAKWVANRTPLWTYIYKIKDDASRPVFLNTIDNAGLNGPAGRILGYPVVQLETGPSATAVSTAIAVFGDFSAVKIGHRLDNIELKLDPYSLGKSNQTAAYLFTRWAFSLALPKQLVRLVTAAA